MKQRQRFFIFTMLSPALLLYGLFVLLPAVNAFRYSLLRWDGLGKPVFIGIQNFVKVFSSASDFGVALKHNIFLTVVPGVFTLSISLYFAYIIHQKVKGARLFRIAFFFPNVISSVAVTLLWILIYSTTDVGLLNHIRKIWFHLPAYAYTQSANLLWALVPMTVWTAVGFYMVLFLAAMENIPESLYEAARLDGAGPARLFQNITIPLMWDVLTTGIIFLVVAGLKAFDAIWIMENGRPTSFTHTLSTLMYSKVFEEYDIGRGTAIAVVLFFLVLGTTLIFRRLLQRERLEY